MPAILATQEAEIRRTEVQSQPGQIVLETLSQKPITKMGWWSGSRCRPQYCEDKSASTIFTFLILEVGGVS
jgi:hypothetical protein